MVCRCGHRGYTWARLHSLSCLVLSWNISYHLISKHLNLFHNLKHVFHVIGPAILPVTYMHNLTFISIKYHLPFLLIMCLLIYCVHRKSPGIVLTWMLLWFVYICSLFYLLWWVITEVSEIVGSRCALLYQECSDHQALDFMVLNGSFDGRAGGSGWVIGSGVKQWQCMCLNWIASFHSWTFCK